MTIFIDFETRSKCDIFKAGAWAYAQHPSTEVLCMAWAIDDEDVQLWLPGEVFPRIIFDHEDSYEAHNASFEIAICNNIMGPVHKVIFHDKWKCSAALCAAHALPRALDKAGAALGLTIQKDQEGKRIMLKLCKPRKPTKNNPAEWHEDPEDYQKLYEYCMDDVRAERAISKRLRGLSKMETRVWQLDQTINQRGVNVDLEAVKMAIKMGDGYTANVGEQLSKLTGGAVERATESLKILAWVQTRGVAMNTVTKQEVADTLAFYDIPADVRKVLEIRQKLGKTSVAKYKAITKAVSQDGRMRGLLMYHGASTGRWTGSRFQPQNLPKNKFKRQQVETYFNVLRLGRLVSFELCYPDVMNTLSQMIRPILIPTKGARFFGGDFAGIEARVLMWLAGDQRALKFFRDGKDIYKDLASVVYSKPAEKITNEERQLGKQGILGAGYGMGFIKFMETCKSYNIIIDEEMAKKVIDSYRSTYKRVANFWYAQEKAAIAAVKTSNIIRTECTTWAVDSNFLHCKLPSGRCLSYYDPKLQMMETPWGKEKETLTYMAVNSTTKQWVREKTYGGKIVENITQAVARDLMAESMLRCEEAGYEIVLTVHDEIISEKVDGDVREFEKLMSEIPEWAKGIPVEVEGWTGDRYLK